MLGLTSTGLALETLREVGLERVVALLGVVDLPRCRIWLATVEAFLWVLIAFLLGLRRDLAPLDVRATLAGALALLTERLFGVVTFLAALLVTVFFLTEEEREAKFFDF